MSSANPTGFFITGTDTNIGKTFVCRLLADTFSEQMPVTYLKPVQTGCVRTQSGELAAPDFEYMKNGKIIQTASYETHVPYRFEPACSPHFAANLANEAISFTHIKTCLEAVRNMHGNPIPVLVEGAGGVYVPLSSSKYMIDLMEFLQLPVILITTPKLGTLNHTFLSINVLQQHSIQLAAVVMNRNSSLAKDSIYTSNRDTIQNAIHPIAFLEIPYNGGMNHSIEKFCDGLKSKFL